MGKPFGWKDSDGKSDGKLRPIPAPSERARKARVWNLTNNKGSSLKGEPIRPVIPPGYQGAMPETVKSGKKTAVMTVRPEETLNPSSIPSSGGGGTRNDFAKMPRAVYPVPMSALAVTAAFAANISSAQMKSTGTVAGFGGSTAMSMITRGLLTGTKQHVYLGADFESMDISEQLNSIVRMGWWLGAWNHEMSLRGTSPLSWDQCGCYAPGRLTHPNSGKEEKISGMLQALLEYNSVIGTMTFRWAATGTSVNAGTASGELFTVLLHSVYQEAVVKPYMNWALEKVFTEKTGQNPFKMEAFIHLGDDVLGSFSCPYHFDGGIWRDAVDLLSKSLVKYAGLRTNLEKAEDGTTLARS